MSTTAGSTNSRSGCAVARATVPLPAIGGKRTVRGAGHIPVSAGMDFSFGLGAGLSRSRLHVAGGRRAGADVQRNPDFWSAYGHAGRPLGVAPRSDGAQGLPSALGDHAQLL